MRLGTKAFLPLPFLFRVLCKGESNETSSKSNSRSRRGCHAKHADEHRSQGHPRSASANGAKPVRVAARVGSSPSTNFVGAGGGPPPGPLLNAGAGAGV